MRSLTLFLSLTLSLFHSFAISLTPTPTRARAHIYLPRSHTNRIMNEKQASSTRYTGPIDCIAKTVRAEGPLALYKGFVPTYLRLAPWQLIFFVLFEQVSIAVTGHTFTSSK